MIVHNSLDLLVNVGLFIIYIFTDYNIGKI